jgi:hypothetical protein
VTCLVAPLSLAMGAVPLSSITASAPPVALYAGVVVALHFTYADKL